VKQWDNFDPREMLHRSRDRIEQLIAEVERLRFALDNIANESSDTWARDWATAALGDTK